MAAVEQRKEVRAQAKWLRISPRKARLVVEHIRGRTVPEARTVLAFTQRDAAREVEKLLKSAVSNAEANHDLLGDNLYVLSVQVDEGPTAKRWRARARGRVTRINKRTCHITLRLAERPGVSPPPAKAEGATPARAPRAKKQAAIGGKDAAAGAAKRKPAKKKKEAAV